MRRSRPNAVSIFHVQLPVIAIILLAALPALMIAGAPAAQAQNFQVIHTFLGPEGTMPVAGLTLDRAGNLYGTTTLGGNSTRTCPLAGCGTVFKLKNNGSGWLLSSLYKFSGGDGEGPDAPVIFGPDGSLYGTAANGGSGGGGTVFNLRPPLSVCKSVSCSWQLSTVFAFGFGTGEDVTAPVSFDAAGNIYGTTFIGGNTHLCGGLGCGTVYQLTKSGSTWTENILHEFTDASDGEYPNSGVIVDQAGNLYGTAPQSDIGESAGLVFALTPSSSGWNFNMVHQFSRADNNGSYPWAGLFFDQAGNMYGAAKFGGPSGGGTVFQLSPSGGNWTLDLIYGLPQGNTGTPAGPVSTPIMDAAGNIYGTTVADGLYGYGTVFKLTSSSGGYSYTTLHDFTGASDGAYPQGGLVIDAGGNLYGTASSGAYHSSLCSSGCGVVFEITP
jgi:uncharacterized repeat protein (TIGR03803 family)